MLFLIIGFHYLIVVFFVGFFFAKIWWVGWIFLNIGRYNFNRDYINNQKKISYQAELLNCVHIMLQACFFFLFFVFFATCVINWDNQII